MRITGLLILFVSFLFIAFDALVGFPARQHTLWMWQTQHLPPSELVPREKASAAIRASCLASQRCSPKYPLPSHHHARRGLALRLLSPALSVISYFSGPLLKTRLADFRLIFKLQMGEVMRWLEGIFIDPLYLTSDAPTDSLLFGRMLLDASEHNKPKLREVLDLLSE